MSEPIEWQTRGRAAVDRLASDDGARWAWRAVLVASVAVFYVVGRDQWFNRDDWAFVLTREQMLDGSGWQRWLFADQDGHWLTVPILLFKGVLAVFGAASYWPYLLLAILSHAAAVLLVRAWCRRLGVSEWTTTILCATLLLFGPGWHNLTFAIQVCYSLSIVCFLGQLWLVDHDGPVDRRDVIGLAVGLIGVMTSGFGPIFAFGVAALLAIRQRWAALAVGVGPLAVAYLWWTWRWAGGGNTVAGDRPQVPAFVVRGVGATFEALTAFPALAGLAVLATLACLLGGVPWAARRVTLALGATVVVMFAGIGWERIGFGVDSAASSRYVGVAALLIAPAFGLAVDRARQLGPEVQWAVRLVLVAAFVVNLGTLRSAGATFARASRHEQLAFELVAGSDRLAEIDPRHVPVPNSPDVNVSDLAWLVAEGTITPRQPANDAERALLTAALGPGIGSLPMP